MKTGLQRSSRTSWDEDEANRRLFVLQIVQPGLAGLMDGSVSTLAPVFAAAFVVGLAASVGAGISMGFAEALLDDSSLDPGFSCRDDRCDASGCDRTGYYFVGPASLHGDAGALGSSASRIGRNPGFRYGCFDRQCLTRLNGHGAVR
jgi:hypothetical protein